MKIEQVIAHHLYSNKQITLPGIGTFRLDSENMMLAHNHKKETVREPAITFEYNPKVIEDASLVEAIVHYTKKMKPLAHADLDSFLTLETELLNLGIPVTLEGIGTLEQTQQGRLTFMPCQSVLNNSESKSAKENNTSLRFKLPALNEPFNIKRIASVAFIIFSICLVSWLLNYIFSEKEKEKNTEGRVKISASRQIINQKNESLSQPSVSQNSMPLEKVTSDYVFKIVFLTTKNKEEALKTIYEINGFGHSAILFTDSSIYKVGIPFKLPLIDSSRIKDSLDQFYSLGKGVVDIKD